MAGSDILDQQGAKLWAQNQPVSQSLQQRLLDRKLKAPFEACLRAEEGITTVHLYEQLALLLASDHALGPAIRPYAAELTVQVRSLPLHAVAQLLLTITHTNRPSAFAHAIEGMALAGAMALQAGYDRGKTRLAMLGGLLHDISEIYIDPHFLETSQPLDADTFRNLATHPLLGAELIKSQMDYPAALWQGIAQHHEKLCGTGYPGMPAAKEIGELGRLLAVVETTLGANGTTDAPLQRASLALRLVPGEYDSAWIGFIARAAATQPSGSLLAADVSEIAQARSTAQNTIDKIRASQKHCASLAADTKNSSMARNVSERVHRRSIMSKTCARRCALAANLFTMWRLPTTTFRANTRILARACIASSASPCLAVHGET